VLESLVSFSSLTHHQRSEPQGAQDEVEATPAPIIAPADPHPELLAWEPLRGTAVGNALHAILERRDPDAPVLDQHALIAASLREHGWSSATRSAGWIERIALRLDAMLAADLGDGLRLADLPPGAQRVEMDFRLRLDAVSLVQLKSVLSAHDEPQLLPASVPLRELSGLLSGKIDLVFEHNGQLHVLDYKSNRLGPSLDDYQPAALARAMDHSGYRFQALLYTLAVHRYLRQRVRGYTPAERLGECWYLFLRGVGLAPGAGVWRHRFPPALIDAVDAVFAGVTA
jgi:exodeoxyribonuclease V beta subunit